MVAMSVGDVDVCELAAGELRVQPVGEGGGGIVGWWAVDQDCAGVPAEKRDGGLGEGVVLRRGGDDGESGREVDAPGNRGERTWWRRVRYGESHGGEKGVEEEGWDVHFGKVLSSK